MNAKISVVIPTYNRARYIRRAVKSVFAQDIPNLEVIVVDDGSADETSSILEEFGNRITVIRQPNLGVSVARSNGVMASKGEYVAFLDSDDEWYPNKLKKQLSVFEKHPDVGLVATGADYINERGVKEQKISVSLHGNITKKLLYQNLIVMSSTLVKRSCLMSIIPLFRSEYKPSEDWELWLRFSARYNIEVIPGIFVRYNILEESLTRQNPPENFRFIYESIYNQLLQDPILQPIVRRNWHHLQANVYSEVSHHYYKQGKTWRARGEMVKAIIKSPVKIKWATAISILLFPPWLRDKLRIFSVMHF